jgi:hypothetical protein
MMCVVCIILIRRRCVVIYIMMPIIQSSSSLLLLLLHNVPCSSHVIHLPLPPSLSIFSILMIFLGCLSLEKFQNFLTFRGFYVSRFAVIHREAGERERERERDLKQHLYCRYICMYRVHHIYYNEQS